MDTTNILYPLEPKGLSARSLRKHRETITRMVVAFANIARTRNELFELLSSHFGYKMDKKKLGNGCYRYVYALPYHLVLKVGSGCHSNEAEWKACNDPKYKPYVAQCFAYVRRDTALEKIDILVSERCIPLNVHPDFAASYNPGKRYKEFEDAFAKFPMCDAGERNWGLTLDDRVVAIDLGNLYHGHIASLDAAIERANQK